MSTDELGKPQDNGGGWIILGILSEVLLRLVNQPDLPSLWEEVCASARWIIRSQRFCVVLALDDGSVEVPVRYAGGEIDLRGADDGVVVDAWLKAALQAQRAGWLKGPWDDVRGIDGLRAWLVADEPGVVFYVPIQIYRQTIGSMIFAIGDHREIDRKGLASATTFALYVGAAYTMLNNARELSVAGERLRAQRDEIEHARRELERQLQVIRGQHEAMLALSTPIIQVWDGVLALPIVGAVDRSRAARTMEAVLAAIVRDQARFVIVDLTGAEATEASTVEHLVRIFAAARLLGSQCIVSGASPGLVKRIVEIEGAASQMSATPAFGSLRRALEHVMQALAREGRRG